MIRGSTYSAILHFTLLAAILFGIPSLTIVLPKLQKKDAVIPVQMMTEKQAEELARAAASSAAQQAETAEPDKDNEVQQPAPSPDPASATEARDRSKPKPKPQPLGAGGVSVVTSVSGSEEGADERDTTRKSAEKVEEGSAVSRASENPGPAGQPAPAQERGTDRPPPRPAEATAQQAPTTASAPLVSRPASLDTGPRTPEALPAVSQAPSTPVAPGPLSPAQTAQAPTAPDVPSSTVAPSATPLGVPDPASSGNAGSEKFAQQGVRGGVAARNDAVSQVIAEMARKIPRLHSLREHLLNKESRNPSPALEQSAIRMAQRADEGYAHAQFSLAEMYLSGEGVQKDTKKAVELFQRAAISGYLPAQLTIGMLAAEGFGMDRNLAEAHTWIAVAADQGNKPAGDALPKLEQRMSTRDIVEARKRSFQLHQVLVIIHGADLSKASKSELSERLRIAAALGDVESVHVLLAQGADADNPDLDGRTAVIEAAWRGYPRIVKTLIDNGAKLDATDNTGKNALMWASINGHAEVINSLIAAGSPLNDRDSEGITALMRAAWNGHADAVQALLQSNADPTLRDQQGLRALEYALKSNNARVAQILSAARG